MSIEHDQSTRKQMRAGISGDNPLRPLDEFSVTHEEFDHAKAMESFKKFVDSMYERPLPSLPERGLKSSKGAAGLISGVCPNKQ